MRHTAPRSRQESGKNLADGRRDRSRRPQKQTAEAPGCLLPPLRSCPRTGWRGQEEADARRFFTRSAVPRTLAFFARFCGDARGHRSAPSHPPHRGSPRFVAPNQNRRPANPSATQPRSLAPHRCGPEIEHRRAVSSAPRQQAGPLGWCLVALGRPPLTVWDADGKARMSCASRQLPC